MFGFSGGGAFNKHSSSTTYATSANLGVSDIDGNAYLFNGSGNTVTDGGAIKGAFEFLNNADAALTERLGMFLNQNENLVSESFANAQGAVVAVADAFKQDASPNRDFMMLGIVAAAVVASVYIFKG